MEKIISREAVSGSIPVLPGIRIRATKQSTSKLKLPKLTEPETALSKTKKAPQPTTLTPIGRVVQSTSIKTSIVLRTPRYVLHAAMITFASTIVIAGSSAGPAITSPFTTQGGYGSVLDQAAAADIAAKVASQANLVIESEVVSTATTLNAQTSMMTAGDGTLAMRQIVDTVGVVTRDISSYTVQPGDTISIVAAKFNITTDTIRWANGIGAEGTLKPGQVLSVLPVSGVRHKVATGDTPESLAAKYEANADQIIAFNNAEVAGLKLGSVIVVPDGAIEDAPMPVAATRLAGTPAASNSSSTKSPAKPSLTSFSGIGNSYSRGYCTYYVASRRPVPSNWGNASSWYYNAQISGFKVGSTPVPGAIAWGGGGYYGHVAYVESVSGGMVTVSEMNWNGNWNRVTSRTAPASSFRYIY